MMSDYNELYHYGVKGMKWGVRRDVQLLAARRANQKIRDAKNKYVLDKDKRKKLIKQAKQEKKEFLNKTKKEYESITTDKKRLEYERKLVNQSIREVPNRTLQKGLRAFNDAMAVYNIGTIGLGAAAGIMMAPAMAPGYIGAAAAGTAISLGQRYVSERMADTMV